jgi:hypothetical protein
MKLGIVINTYQKSDGSTPKLLTRAVDSIKTQTHHDYVLIIVGDKYEDGVEFQDMCDSFALGDKLVYENLPFAVERDKYPMGSKELWSAGGVNALNYGIELALSLGLSYICRLDHDDYWHPQHLEIINHTIEATGNAPFIHTCSTYFNTHLPRVELTNEIQPTQIKPGGLIHSSVCVNFKQIPLRYRDVFEETGQEFPADADMWVRIGNYIKENTLKSYQITSLTCFHPTENI